MCNLNGTITTPWFGEEYPILGKDKQGKVEYYKKDKEFLLTLELPDDIKEQVRSGSLIIELEVDSWDEAGWNEQISINTAYKMEKTWVIYYKGKNNTITVVKRHCTDWYEV